ncbi:hypothetical protein BMS3Abin09_01285 [bacterium BMS3Abin09]|nr:hypothetical protein BMS3Abin09_01285 [bacterium BMS3Abin09]GBE40649.1 hypothetical protein BMS3Bbin09_00535 [bacterium BMS3Bbin09]
MVELGHIFFYHPAGAEHGAGAFYRFFHDLDPLVGDAIIVEFIIERYYFGLKKIINFFCVAVISCSIKCPSRYGLLTTIHPVY